MTAVSEKTFPEPPPRATAALEAAAFACILAVMAARPFMAEVGFRAAEPPLAVAGELSEQVSHRSPAELVRLSCAVILLAAAAMWTLGQACRQRWQLSGTIFAAALAAFAAWSFVSALKSVDARGGLTGWVEQASILLAGFVILQLARRRGRWLVVLAVLAAIAATTGLKTIAQATFELPVTRKAFLANTPEQLATRGVRPGTAQARMFQTRLLDRGCFGYLGLSNMLASMMLPLLAAAGGLAIEKIVQARRDRKLAPVARQDVHLPTVAAGGAVALAALAGVGLVLTRSKGGIGAGAVALAVAAVVAWRRAFFARRRRAALIACGIVTAAVVAAAAGWGTARGSLPGGESMQVRWEYWAGSAGLVEDSPLWGVGPGNFSHGYLPHRLAAAAESPKTAHNVIVDAICAYGTGGGVIFLAMLAWILVAATSPGSSPGPLAQPGRRVHGLRWCLFLGMVVLAARMAWIGTGSAELLVLEAAMPGVVFACLVLVAMWTGGSSAGVLAGPTARFAVVAGLAAMALHNLVTYSLFSPATATAFWIAAGAVAGAGRLRTRQLGQQTAVASAIVAVIAAAGAGLWLWRPVYERTMHVRAAEQACADGDMLRATRQMSLAVEADALDGLSPANLAKLWLSGPAQPPDVVLDEAAKWADLAWRRMPTAAHAALLADALWQQAEPSQWLFGWRGRTGDLKKLQARIANQLRLHPDNRRLMNALAEVLLLQGEHQNGYDMLRRTVAKPTDQAKLYENFGDAAWRSGHADAAAIAWATAGRLYAAAVDAELRDRALALAGQAVALDPMNIGMLTDYAGKLHTAGRHAAAAEQIAIVRLINSLRPKVSDLRLSAAELAELGLLEEKVTRARRRGGN